MKENLKLILLFLLIVTIAGTNVFNYFVTQQKEEQSSANYNNCILAEEQKAQEIWEQKCAERFFSSSPFNCALPTDIATILKQAEYIAKLGCLRHYMH